MNEDTPEVAAIMRALHGVIEGPAIGVERDDILLCLIRQMAAVAMACDMDHEEFAALLRRVADNGDWLWQGAMRETIGNA